MQVAAWGWAWPRVSRAPPFSPIKRRYESVEVTGPLQALGRPFTKAEKRARREAGKNGPKGPGVQQ